MFKRLLIVLLLTLSSAPSMACERFPIHPNEPIREYLKENGLLFQEYDLDGDGKADYGTASQVFDVAHGQIAQYPLFYAYGHDEPSILGTNEPFMAGAVFIDKGGKGRCEDIVFYWIRMNKDQFTPKERA